MLSVTDRCTCVPYGTDFECWTGSICEACERRMEEETARESTPDESHPNWERVQ